MATQEWLEIQLLPKSRQKLRDCGKMIPDVSTVLAEIQDRKLMD